MIRPAAAWRKRSALGLLVFVAGLLACRVLVVDWLHVPSTSMEPTLRVGDQLLVNRLAYGARLPFTRLSIALGRPRRGDVVVFRLQGAGEPLQVKRIVALGGDRVDFSDGVAAINGEPPLVDDQGWGGPADLGHRLLKLGPVGRDYRIKLNPFVLGRLPMDIGPPACNRWRPGAWTCTVPAGHLMLLGDNRDNAEDSRAWGFLPEHALHGRVDRVLFNPRDPTRRWLSL